MVPIPVKVTTQSPSAAREMVFVKAEVRVTAQSFGKDELTARTLRGVVGGKLGMALTVAEAPAPAKFTGVTLK